MNDEEGPQLEFLRYEGIELQQWSPTLNTIKPDTLNVMIVKLFESATQNVGISSRPKGGHYSG